MEAVLDHRPTPTWDDLHTPDKPHCNCGLIAIVQRSSRASSINDVLDALSDLHNRGDDGAGTFTQSLIRLNKTHYYRKKGSVADVVKEMKARIPENLINGPYLLIGHTRYGTTGANIIRNLQPYITKVDGKIISIAHNGNLVNHNDLRHVLQELGYDFKTTSDSEVFLHLLAYVEKVADQYAPNMPAHQKLRIALEEIKGAYSLIVSINGEVLAAKDPDGVRPLAYGKSLNGELYIASETMPLDSKCASLNELPRGTILQINKDGEFVEHTFKQSEEEHFCMLDANYLMHYLSKLQGIRLEVWREKLGEQLAKLYPDYKGMVGDVPMTAIPLARGYLDELNIIPSYSAPITISKTWEQGKRDYISPTGSPSNKHTCDPDLIHGEVFTLIDDSFIRGTTIKKIVKLLKDAGAKEIHLLSATPKVIFECEYGIRMNKDHLIARKEVDGEPTPKSDEEIALELGADTVRYMTLEAYDKIRKGCTACIDGNYFLGRIKDFPAGTTATSDLAFRINAKIREFNVSRVVSGCHLNRT